MRLCDKVVHFFRGRYVPKIISLLAVALAGVAFTSNAQQLTGTLSGTVVDQAGAVVSQAKVELKNEASGDVRVAVSDNSGHFVITAVQPASYSITIAATGFAQWEENSIVMNQGDNRNIPNIKLQVGTVSSKVEVVGAGDAIVPVDTAEISTSINEQMINDFPLQGRDAGELLKVMPGMGLNNSGSIRNNFNDQIVGSNNGPIGSFSGNGTQPQAAMAFMLDGANLVDPGNLGTQIANINQDMVSSVKVLMSNYSAEYAKGPVIFQAFSKSGGQNFHGEGYLYTHNAALNAVDAYTKSQGGTNQAQSYYYIGGNAGGPVLLPFLHFNQDRKKLFFWAGYEYMKQQPAGQILNFNVPNAAQLAGDFSNANIPSAAISTWPGFYSQLTNALPSGATATSLPTSNYDPNILGIMKLYPGTNQTPSIANGYSNYHYTNQEPQNRWEATGKLDYAISDNTKLTGSYTYQKENDISPISIWWAEPWTLPTPSPSISNTVTNVILTNFTHVFNPTTTNEAVFTLSHFVNPYKMANPSASSRSTNNFNVQGLFGQTTNQIPNFNGPWPGTMASLSNYTFTPGYFGGTKQVPAFYDNVTKVVSTHTLKFGFYWDSTENKQTGSGPDNGTYNYGGSQYSTNNLVADMELGRIQSYQQQNYNPMEDVKFHQWSIYAQDSWKATPQLTVNYGVRLDHIGQWYGMQNGMQVWNPSSYVNSPDAPANTGLIWHSIDRSVPDSGFPSKLFNYAPRVGLAWDVFGTGKTVFRGGFAVFRYQWGAAVAEAGTGPLDSFEYTTPTAFEGYASITNFTPPSSTAQNGSDIHAIQAGDDRTPFTNDWNATISQALPWRSVLEVSYIGNRTANEFMDGSGSNLFNLNNVPRGSIFGIDPVLGQYVSPAAPPCSTTDPTQESLYCQQNPGAYTPAFNANDFRPMSAYQNMYLLSHAPYSNYNSLQVSYQKQSGPVTFLTNYTFSKVLGIRDSDTGAGAGNGPGVDPFVLRNNYGPLAFDHTHIVNLTYNWRMPSFIQARTFGTHLLAGVINGWQLSGYTSFQSGVPLQPFLGGGMNATFPGGLTVPTVAHPNLPDNSILLPNGLRAVSVGTAEWFGSTAYNTLIPVLTCDPRKNLHNGQRFNPDCFTTPAYGQQGPTNLPYMRTPNYFNNDLGIYKSFRVREGQSLQFRASATNWLNHPLPQFGLANSSDESISFTQISDATCSGCVDQNAKPLQVTSLSPTNTNSLTTGKPAFKAGSRFVTLAIKYYF